MKSIAHLNDFTVKKVVIGRGHDCGGLICDVYFKKKKIAEFHDDGWGGEPEIHFLNKGDEETIGTYFKKNNFAQIEFDKLKDDGYTFFKTVEDVDFKFIFSNMVEELSVWSLVEKDTKKGLCVGSLSSYGIYSYKGVRKIEDILKFKNGLSVLQKDYDKIKKEGKNVLNSQEQLLSLGIKI